jgi:hypothetical protein
VVPVAVNAVLLATFALSLTRGQPMAERFARMTSPTLDARQIRYCRSVTIAWCVFFGLNGATAAVLAVFAPLSWWAAFTGVVSYVLVGLMLPGVLRSLGHFQRRGAARRRTPHCSRESPGRTPSERTCCRSTIGQYAGDLRVEGDDRCRIGITATSQAPVFPGVAALRGVVLERLAALRPSRTVATACQSSGE